jgi:diadenosine tetraphosphatase ApaH/serine/threonine PP2A family protein phosphatase
MALIAFLTDIHSNLPALEACIAAAEEAGAERFVLLGDFVGYGGQPGAVLDRVMELVRDGAIAVRGNHDDMTADFDREMNPVAASAANWTRAQLTSVQRAFLDALPYRIEDGERLYVHADASEPRAWKYVTGPMSAATSLRGCDARVTFCGHVHQPALYAALPDSPPVHHTPLTGVPVPLIRSRRWHVVLGAVGQPRDGDPDASWALYDTKTDEITFERAEYDVDAAAAAIHAAGLPPGLARRLYEGR